MNYVRVRVFATLRKHLSGEDALANIRIDGGKTVGDICSELGIPHDEVKVVFVNDHKAPLRQVLQPGDRVSIFPPIAGG